MRRAKDQAPPPRPPRPKPPQTASLRLGVEMLFRALFAIPAVAGQGDHWVLADEEARTVAEQGEAALASLPAGKLTAATKFFSKVAPWVALFLTLVTMIYARYLITKELYARAAALRGATPGGGPAPHAATNGDGGIPGGGAAPGAGAAKDRLSQHLEGAEG